MSESILRELEALDNGTTDSIYYGYEVARADELTTRRPKVIMRLGDQMAWALESSLRKLNACSDGMIDSVYPGDKVTGANQREASQSEVFLRWITGSEAFYHVGYRLN